MLKNATTHDIWINYAQVLRQFIRSKVNSDDIADDLLQTVFIKIHSKISSLDDNEKLESWIYRISQNTVIDYYRSDNSNYKKHSALPEDLTDKQPEESIYNGLQACLSPMIKSLPKNYQEAIYFSEIKELPHKDIAKLQNISLSGAKSRIQRGRKLLKIMLHECCEFELNQQGNITDYTRKNNDKPNSCSDSC